MLMLQSSKQTETASCPERVPLRCRTLFWPIASKSPTCQESDVDDIHILPKATVITETVSYISPHSRVSLLT